MPPHPPTPTPVLKVRFKMTYADDPSVATGLYFAYSGTAPTGAQLTTFAGVLAAEWATAMSPLQASNISLVEIDCEDIGSSTGASGTWTGTHAGTRGGTSLTGQVCVIMNYAIARRYRGGKPKGFFPAGVAGDLADADTWGSSFRALMVAAVEDIVTAGIGAPWTGATIPGTCNVSYYEGFDVFIEPSGRARNISKLRAGGPVVDTVLTYTANPKVGTQRRRISA